MNSTDIQTARADERMRDSHGLRKKFKGVRGQLVRVKGGYKVVPRAHTHGGHSEARAGYTVDDTHDKSFGKVGKETKSSALGPYRVQMPRNRTKYVRGPKHDA